jgi:peptide/nickel transport system substrate-binding protein
MLLLGLCALCCRRPVQPDEGFPRDETLYVGGFQWSQPSTFNPLDQSPSWPLNPHTGQNLFYETLQLFNSSSGEIEPMLAASHSVGPDSIEIELQPEARFVDGSPVTADDVKYTFDLGQRHKGLRVATVWPFLREVVASPDGRHVRFVLEQARKNPLMVLDALQEIPIIPRHVVEPLLQASGDDMNQFTKLKFEVPMGSGPYTLHSYSAEKIVAERRDYYWGNAVFFGGKRAAPK